MKGINLTINLTTILSLSILFKQGWTSLDDDFEKFYDVISFEDVASAFLETYRDDPTFAVAADFLVSQDFDNLIQELLISPYCEEFILLMEENNVPIARMIGKARQLIRRPPFPVRSNLPLHPGHGDLMPFITNLVSYVILTDIENVYRDVRANSVAFQNFLELTESPEFLSLQTYVFESMEFANVNSTLLMYGIDIPYAISYVQHLTVY